MTYAILTGPGILMSHGIEVRVVSDETDAVYTTFGTFVKPDLTWRVDSRFKIELIDEPRAGCNVKGV